MVHRVLRAGGGGLAGEVEGVRVSGVYEFQKIVCADMFEQEVEGGAVVMMLQVT